MLGTHPRIAELNACGCRSGCGDHVTQYVS
jgi:hypothetical protein